MDRQDGDNNIKRRNQETVKAATYESMWAWIIIALAASVLALFFPPLAVITPVLYVVAGVRSRSFALAPLTLLCFIAAFAIKGDALVALGYTVLICGFGDLMFFMQRYGFKNFECTAAGALMLTLGLFLVICLPGYRAGEEFFAGIKAAAASVENGLSAWMSAQLVDPQLGTVARELIHELALNAVDLAPSIIYVASAMGALLSVLLLHLVNRKLDMPIKPLPGFAMWRVTGYYSTITLVLCVVAYLLVSDGSVYGDSLWGLAFMMWMLPMAAVGLCYIYGLTRGRRSFLFPAACALSVLCLPFSLYGLLFFGIFANYNDIKRKQKELREKREKEDRGDED